MFHISGHVCLKLTFKRVFLMYGPRGCYAVCLYEEASSHWKSTQAWWWEHKLFNKGTVINLKSAVWLIAPEVMVVVTEQGFCSSRTVSLYFQESTRVIYYMRIVRPRRIQMLFPRPHNYLETAP